MANVAGLLKSAGKMKKGGGAAAGKGGGTASKLLALAGPEGMVAGEILDAKAQKDAQEKQEAQQQKDAEQKKKDAEQQAGQAEGAASSPGSGGKVGKGLAFAGGAAAGAIAAGGTAAGNVSASVGEHVKENPFFLFVLFVSLLDAFNNMSRGASPVQVNMMMTVSIVVLLIMSMAAPTKILFGVLGLIVMGFVFAWTGYLNYEISTGIPASALFFILFLIIFFWAWMGVFKEEGNFISKGNLKIAGLSFALSALAFYMPIIRDNFLPAGTLIDGIVVIAPVWLVYLMIFKPETQLVKTLGAFYIIFWIIFFLVKGGVVAAVMDQATFAQKEGAEDESKKGAQDIVETLKKEIETTGKVLRGEALAREVSPETKNLFIGMELQDPYFANKLKFDPDIDRTLTISSRLNYMGYKTLAQGTLACYAATTTEVKSSDDLWDPLRFSIGTSDPSNFMQNIPDVIDSDNVKCTYDSASRKHQTLFIQADATQMTTGAHIEPYFIDNANLEQRLTSYVQSTKSQINTIPERIAVYVSLYEGLPTKMTSYSDKGPALLVIGTEEPFPLIGVDASKTVTLKSAVENLFPTSVKVKDVKGRIAQLYSVTIILPDGFAPASGGCDGWTASGDRIVINQDKLEIVNKKLKKLKEGKQEFLPDCKLAMTDRDTLLLKPDKPNVAPFDGIMSYAYTIQRTFKITSEKPTAPKNTTAVA